MGATGGGMQGGARHPVAPLSVQAPKSKLSKLQQAQEEYKNKPSFSFMQSKTDNYWTENQKIIQSYAQYY